MEPRPLSHGYLACRRCRYIDFRRLQWSHGLSAMDTWAINVATPASSTLQWSHGLSAMDTWLAEDVDISTFAAFNGATASQPWIPRNGQRVCIARTVPSMEPRPLSHGYQVERTPPEFVIEAFNGATASQPWILRIFRIFRPNGTVRACDSRIRRAKCFSIDRCCLIISDFCPLFVRALSLQQAHHSTSRTMA